MKRRRQKIALCRRHSLTCDGPNLKKPADSDSRDLHHETDGERVGDGSERKMLSADDVEQRNRKRLLQRRATEGTSNTPVPIPRTSATRKTTTQQEREEEEETIPLILL